MQHHYEPTKQTQETSFMELPARGKVPIYMQVWRDPRTSAVMYNNLRVFPCGAIWWMDQMHCDNVTVSPALSN